MSNLRILLLVTLFIPFTFMSCDSNSGSEQTTSSGIKYKYLNKGDGEQPKDGDILLLNMQYYTGDSLLFDSNSQGAAMPLQKSDSLWSSKEGSIEEMFKMMRKGDSLEFFINATVLFNETFMMEVPEFIEEDSDIKFIVGVEDVEDEDTYMERQMERMQRNQAEQAERREETIANEVREIEEYIKDNKLDAQMTSSGVYYVVEKAGSNNTPETGDLVSVHYTGKLFSNGEVFDSSVERGEPIQFTIGMGEVIRGWDEGIGMFGKGGKGQLIIPSPLAYGEQARGDVIPANSILVFDIELVDFEKQPAQ
ncbi:MAG: FKBP-type peptidyl-prolyl cis-trans isomerase [Cyclobacteriaceae bacterium]|nr:FKBP-type peptidyl-prolyl cis-trans isomerase [Cyclobacteriaceae bacterium]MCH8515091.1 FKBP-type peptidyl-prolyl cis-trans isomerase [Cyclobacteriaceae bacterium]